MHPHLWSSNSGRTPPVHPPLFFAINFLVHTQVRTIDCASVFHCLQKACAHHLYPFTAIDKQDGPTDGPTMASDVPEFECELSMVATTEVKMAPCGRCKHMHVPGNLRSVFVNRKVVELCPPCLEYKKQSTSTRAVTEGMVSAFSVLHITNQTIYLSCRRGPDYHCIVFSK